MISTAMNRYCRSTLGALVLISLAACGEHSDTSEPVAEQSQASDKRTTSVNVAAVERRQLQAWVYSQGTARSRQREFLTFTQQGVVSYVDPQLRVGMPVKTGQVIAHQAPERVEADLQAAKASLAEAQASLKLAEVTQTRYKKLIEQRSASQQELDEARVQVQQARAVRDNARAELAQAQLSVDESRLVSPMNGVLARLNIEKGRYFMPNTVQADTEQNALRTVPALVIDPDRFEVRVDLPSYNFRQIETGAQAVIGENPSVAGQDVDPLAVNTRVEGQVYAVSPSLDPETRTFEVIVHTRNNETGLQDGEFVAVWIAEPSVDDALVVPLAALRFRNDQAFVFVANEEKGTVSERRVELAQQSGDYRAVASGLETGELVVTEGRAALNDGQQVRIIHAGENAP